MWGKVASENAGRQIEGIGSLARLSVEDSPRRTLDKTSAGLKRTNAIDVLALWLTSHHDAHPRWIGIPQTSR